VFKSSRGSLCYAAIWLAFAPTLLIVGCGPKVEGRVEVEVRRLQDDSCDSCISVRFRNAYTQSDLLLVRQEPDFVLSGESFSRIDAVSFDYEPEGRVVWKARVSLTLPARERVSRFRSALGSTRRLLLITAAGHPIDVMMSGQFVGEMFLGSFDSADELKAVFSTAKDRGAREVVEASPEFEKTIDRLEAAAKRDASEGETIGALVDALVAGDSKKAQELKAELENRGGAQPSATETKER
jgi:hypothetical protein